MSRLRCASSSPRSLARRPQAPVSARRAVVTPLHLRPHPPAGRPRSHRRKSAPRSGRTGSPVPGTVLVSAPRGLPAGASATRTGPLCRSRWARRPAHCRRRCRLRPGSVPVRVGSTLPPSSSDALWVLARGPALTRSVLPADPGVELGYDHQDPPPPPQTRGEESQMEHYP